MADRPREFRLNYGHQLAQGLVFAGLGRHSGSTYFCDSSLYNNAGTLTNMDPATDWVWDSMLGRWCTEHVAGNAVLLPGTIVGVLDFTAGPFTMSAWVKRTASAQTYKTILGKRDSSGYQYVFRLSSNKFSLLRTGTLVDAITATTESVWQHGCVVVNADGTGAFYLNGAPDGTFINKSIAHNATANVYVASYGSSGGLADFIGALCDVTAWNRVLSVAEISGLADPSNTMLSGLVLPPKRRIWAAVTVGGPTIVEPATVAAAWLVVPPTLTETVKPVATSAIWSVVVPTTKRAVTPSAVTSEWSPVAPTLVKTVKPSTTVLAEWSVVNPATVKGTVRPSHAVATWNVQGISTGQAVGSPYYYHFMLGG